MNACHRISLSQFTEDTNHDSPQLHGAVAQDAPLYALLSRVKNFIPEQG